MLTYLAIAFVIFLIGAVLYGFGIVVRKPPTKEELDSAQCFLCKSRFDRHLLVERVIGDSKIVYFCRQCISDLKRDLNIPSTSSSSS